MRVLISGMTASQVNPVNHMRSPNFSGILCDAYTHNGNVVSWTEPSVEWDDFTLSEFDQVVIGVAPLTAMGANRAYGALSIIHKMWDDPRLRLLVDAPDPLKMQSANQSLMYHPDNLVKDFYVNRKEFKRVKADPALQAKLLQAVSFLNFREWPKTIVPQLPWQSTSQLESQLPNAKGRVLPVNLDRLIVNRFPNRSTDKPRGVWSYEPGSHPSWSRSNDVTWPVINLPKTHRRDTTEETLQLLSESVGCIICPSKSGTWWSPRFAMSLSQGTPVFTDWHETQYLSQAWTHLPGSFELMSPDERETIAREQRESYVTALPEYLPEI